jgi:hypothetical protein
MRAASRAQLELPFTSHGGRPSEQQGPATATGPLDEGPIASQRKRIGGLLTVLLPHPVDVVFTDNSSTMVSFKERLGRLELRLHRMFRHADDGVLGTLARFVLSRDRAASRDLDRFIRRHRDEIRQTKRRAPSLGSASGRHQDLRAVLDTVCRDYFGGELDVKICWGRRSSRKRRRRGRTRSRALATYSYDARTIRVSPVLDSPDVPEYMLEWIVYHELLHHVLPIEHHSGRSRYHTGRFKALERAFRKYDEAKSWEEENLEWLLR